MTRVAYALDVGVAVAGLIGSSAMAQTLSANAFESCRSQAIAKGVSREEYGQFLDDCVGDVATSASPAQARYAQCHSQARTTQPRGAAYGKALDQCMSGSAAGATATGGTYTDCRNHAASRKLSGDELGRFTRLRREIGDSGRYDGMAPAFLRSLVSHRGVASRR